MEMFNLYITFILGVVVFQIAIVCANNTDCLNGHNLNIELAIALRDRIKCVKKAGKYQLVLLISSFIICTQNGHQNNCFFLFHAH